MSLQEKYSGVINLAKELGVEDLQVREQDNVLYIDGTAKSADDKEKIWNTYAKLDPDFRAADLVMAMEVKQSQSTTSYVVKEGDSLSKIGKEFGISWQTIYEANKEIISNPDLIQVGWKLNIPTS